jgi:hypothetical protein
VDPTASLAMVPTPHWNTDQSRSVYLLKYLDRLSKFDLRGWHGVVSKACEKVPALAQLKRWSLRLGDPLMNKSPS